MVEFELVIEKGVYTLVICIRLSEVVLFCGRKLIAVMLVFRFLPICLSFLLVLQIV